MLVFGLRVELLLGLLESLAKTLHTIPLLAQPPLFLHQQQRGFQPWPEHREGNRGHPGPGQPDLKLLLAWGVPRSKSGVLAP